MDGSIPSRVRAWWRGLTRRNRTEEALRDRQAQLRLLMEHAPFCVQLFDPDGTLRQVNRAWEKMWGVRAEEVVGKYNALAAPQIDAMGQRALVERSFAGETVDFGEALYVPSESNMPGRERWVRTQGYPILDEAGQLRHVALLSEDITERKQAQEHLRQSEEQYRALVEQINDVIFTLDEEGRFTYVSPVVEHVSEFTPDDLIGQPFMHFVHPDDFEDLLASYQRTLGGAVEPFEFRTPGKNDTMRYVRSFSRPIYEDGKPVGVRGVLMDLTERKRIEQERERLIEELEAKNAELERFTYTVSHDLKSPLVTIRGFLGLLEEDALAGNVEKMKQDIRQIQGATDKMQLLLGDLLELSRIGRLMNPPEAVLLTDLAREALDLVAGQIAERGVDVVMAPGMPTVYGDRTRLLEIFQNLLDNAVKFMGRQPDPRVEITAEVHDGEVVCSVKDNGMGIDPKHHDKVFGLFERLHREIAGTGVGLTLVKRIVEVHGGTISVASDGEGCGCTFTFSLPLGG